MSESSTPPVAVMPPAWGWRVVYFLRRPPWVREEAVAAFRLGEHTGKPMVRGTRETFIADVDESTPYALAAPGEPAEMFVEEAKAREQQHRRWLVETRDQRKEEKRIQQVMRELERLEQEFEASGRTVPRGHPALPLFDRFRFLSQNPGSAAAELALGWFLVEHCTFGKEHEVGLSAFRARLDTFMDAYEIPHLVPAALSRAMHLDGLDPVRFKGKIDGWTGVGLREDPPRVLNDNYTSPATTTTPPHLTRP